MNAQIEPSVADRTEAVLGRIAAREPTLQAFVELNSEAALVQARALDALPPERRGPLHGWPLAVKEIFDVEGLRSPLGSPVHADRRAAATAPAVQRLVAAGAVVLGITRATEYALAAVPPTVHPLDARRSPGASSSGSAAAVGARLVPLALGSQTIGSIIRPAAYCGAVGFKPGIGVYPTQGMLTLCEALDHPGLIGDTVQRVAAAHAVLVGKRMAAPRADAPLALCLLAPWHDEALAPAQRDVIDGVCHRLRRAGCELRELRVPAAIARVEAQVLDTLLSRDLARHHGAFLRRHAGQVSAELMAWAERGAAVGEAAYAEALRQQAHIAGALNVWLRPGEVAITAATLDVAPLREHGSGSRAPQRLWTLAGLPTLTLPAGSSQGLPLGVQLVGRRGEECTLLAQAQRLEALVEVEAAR